MRICQKCNKNVIKRQNPYITIKMQPNGKF